MKDLPVRLAVIVIACVGLLAFGACGDDDNGGGGSGGDAGTGGTGGGGLSVQVSWEALQPCATSIRSDYEVTVVVEGEVAPVTVGGSVTPLCTGPIDMLGVNTISCPNTGLYNGTVTVTDAAGSDEVQFTISPCMNGSAP